MLKLVIKQNLKIKICISLISFIGGVILLDWLVFSILFLQIPNELEWDTSPWYNFLQKKDSIKFSDSKKSVLIAGSSVAMYSYLPQQVDKSLTDENSPTKSEFYAHVAMSPTDLFYYADDIISKKPNMILYLVNPGDFQMDHFSEANGTFSEYNEAERIHSYSYRHPVKFYYPLAFLKDNFTELQKKEILPLLTKSMLYVNRYRSFISDPIDAYFEHHTRSGTSYHNYTGANLNPIQWRKGWTNKNFQVHCNLKDKSKFSETIYIPQPDTEIQIFNQGNLLFKDSFPNSGWKKVNFSIPNEIQSNELNLNFTVSKTISSKVIDKKVYGKEYFYGIRLSQNFCKPIIERDFSYNKMDSLDDQILQEMSDEEYEIDYFEKMYKDADSFIDAGKKIPLRPEILRLYHLHKVKKFLNKKGPYRWSEFEILEKAARKFQEKKIPFIIVNNPENPLELNLYKDSDWYADYLKFFSELSNKHNVKFYDKKDSISKTQDFIDSHHLTYSGSVKMINIYSSIIKENSR